VAASGALFWVSPGVAASGAERVMMRGRSHEPPAAAVAAPAVAEEEAEEEAVAAVAVAAVWEALFLVAQPSVHGSYLSQS